MTDPITLAAIVTGGESGIGRACALALGRSHVPVVLTYYADKTAADAVVAAIAQAGGQALACQCDVGHEAAVDALFASAEARFGPVHMLVNSAGLNMSDTPVESMELGQFDRVLKADLYGPFLTCRRFVRGLDRRRGDAPARIVNVSSIHERAPRAGGLDYDAAKGGLAQLTATLALELAPRQIAVNAVAPGMILTPMNQSALDDPQVLATKQAAIPWGRAGTANEVADLVLFLLSDKATYITGTTVTIDGALSLTVAQGA
ncbi:glucose 1-dehydrogenase [Novosphingobium hassiacum]|uniref:Glucose 1-dehydrogenase n=1 Tax=Novosphingobium hassiacum TaxID=173676 RepID=A0A7W5ZRR8_9SPHN|nr:SDR family oxidoreductase [Novosphingobium hassiacum]MBB3858801.1 glucose 1-dehydrogenase [Novosphingobium hassiacum]